MRSKFITRFSDRQFNEQSRHTMIKKLNTLFGKKVPSFPVFRQLDAKDCGPTCLKMIARYYGKSFSLPHLREACQINRQGVSLFGISEAAEKLGFRSMGALVTFEQLVEKVTLPAIIHWEQKHFIIVYHITEKWIYAADPAQGKIRYTHEEFKRGWIAANKNGESKGVCLVLEPGPAFIENEELDEPKKGFGFLWKYLPPHRPLLTQLALGLLVGSIVQLIFPFLTQAIVDIGINTRDLDFVYLVLIAQLVLFFGKTTVDFIRSRILLHINSRINVSLVSDFLIKLMQLPMGFFDSRHLGDLLQRIEDHKRIERFLTSQSLGAIFGLFNLVIFGLVLAIYSLKIFALFFIGSLLYFAWVILFMKKRRQLDGKRFGLMAKNQSKLIQMISGMQEIKLTNSEVRQRWEWEGLQARLFEVNSKALSIRQSQGAGAVFINETKNILITVLTATAVLHGEMTLGMMVAVQYIIGQMNGPIDQLVGFLQTAQDAQLSLERLGEIHEKEEETSSEAHLATSFSRRKTLAFENVSFHYPGAKDELVLNDVSLNIPENKVTAIVGASGSGKTTLLKLLMGFYPTQKGKISLGDQPLSHYHPRWWRQQVGAVMQDGFIFSDTIARNICPGDEEIDKERLFYAASQANIVDFIEQLPLSFNTMIGQDGHGLSQGQKQRLLIARAIYKDPPFLFFDEATNALDAQNESQIMKNLNRVYQNRTVIVVAHRLSTVRNADQIVVLDKGQITELGTHEELTAKEGTYYHLVKNQLELGIV